MARLQRDTNTPWLPCGLTALITNRVIRHYPHSLKCPLLLRVLLLIVSLKRIRKLIIDSRNSVFAFRGFIENSAPRRRVANFRAEFAACPDQIAKSRVHIPSIGYNYKENWNEWVRSIVATKLPDCYTLPSRRVWHVAQYDLTFCARY